MTPNDDALNRLNDLAQDRGYLIGVLDGDWPYQATSRAALIDIGCRCFSEHLIRVETMALGDVEEAIEERSDSAEPLQPSSNPAPGDVDFETLLRGL